MPNPFQFRPSRDDEAYGERFNRFTDDELTEMMHTFEAVYDTDSEPDAELGLDLLDEMRACAENR